MEAPPPTKQKPAGVTFVLENANLEAAKVQSPRTAAHDGEPRRLRDFVRVPRRLARRPLLPPALGCPEPSLLFATRHIDPSTHDFHSWPSPAQVGKGYVLLNSDDHKGFLGRHGKDPADYRPDICHQALLAILDRRVDASALAHYFRHHPSRAKWVRGPRRARGPPGSSPAA